MRALFMAMAVVGICGCAGNVPYMDLRKPIYMVPEKSFWVGCEHDPFGYAACRNYRITKIKDGVSQWFKYFDKTARPQVVIVRAEKELPPHRVNRTIYLKIEAGFCGNGHAACYPYGPFTSPKIVFESSYWITSRIAAHEFGHALGLDDNYTPKGVESVMSYTTPTGVVHLDVVTMCRIHHECRMVRRKLKKN